MDKRSDTDAVRSAFRCTRNAFPANSPSTPNIRESNGELHFLLGSSSRVFLIASSGVITLSFLAGIHADIPMVIAVINSVNKRISGWYPNTDARLPSISCANISNRARSPILPAMPSSVPRRIGAAHRYAASCKRQVRICLGVAPMLDKIPNWWILACMDTAKALCMITISEKEASPIINRNSGNTSLGASSFASRTRYIAISAYWSPSARSRSTSYFHIL